MGAGKRQEGDSCEIDGSIWEVQDCMAIMMKGVDIVGMAWPVFLSCLGGGGHCVDEFRECLGELNGKREYCGKFHVWRRTVTPIAINFTFMNDEQLQNEHKKLEFRIEKSTFKGIGRTSK